MQTPRKTLPESLPETQSQPNPNMITPSKIPKIKTTFSPPLNQPQKQKGELNPFLFQKM